jgi:hypothetical protein
LWESQGGWGYFFFCVEFGTTFFRKPLIRGAQKNKIYKISGFRDWLFPEKNFRRSRTILNTPSSGRVYQMLGFKPMSSRTLVYYAIGCVALWLAPIATTQKAQVWILHDLFFMENYISPLSDLRLQDNNSCVHVLYL